MLLLLKSILAGSNIAGQGRAELGRVGMMVKYDDIYDLNGEEERKKF